MINLSIKFLNSKNDKTDPDLQRLDAEIHLHKLIGKNEPMSVKDDDNRRRRAIVGPSHRDKSKIDCTAAQSHDYQLNYTDTLSV